MISLDAREQNKFDAKDFLKEVKLKTAEEIAAFFNFGCYC